jgi:hypothetical protein
MTGVIVAGALAAKLGHGGAAWTRLSWIFALRELGLRTTFVEQIDDAQCIDESGLNVPLEQSLPARYFMATVEAFGLADSAALIRTSNWHRRPTRRTFSST